MGIALSTTVTGLWISILLPNSQAIISDFKADEIPEMIGGVFALIVLLSWLLSPVYILTRPVIINAFEKSGNG